VDLKKHLFVVVLTVICLIAIGAYVVMVPSISEQAEEKKKQCEAKAGSIADLASKADSPDAIKTAKHVFLADSYDKKVSAQLDELKKLWAAKGKLELRYDNMPRDNTFDMALSKLRKDLIKKAADANLELPADIEKMMFNDPATDPNSIEPSLTPPYRLRHMAIMDEIITVLCSKFPQDVLKWTPEGDREATDRASIGALRIEKMKIAPKPRSSLEKPPGVTEALVRGGRKDSAAGKGFPGPELPYVITPVDIVFVASPAAVPPLLKALESSNRWFAVISRFDMQRLVPPYADRGSLEMAGANAWVNSHYQEGPVRVLVTLDLYEHSPGLEKSLATWIDSLGKAAPTTAKK